MNQPEFSPEIQIADALPQDAPVLVGLRAAGWDSQYRGHVSDQWLDDHLSRIRGQESIDKMQGIIERIAAGDESSAIRVAVRAGQIIGFAAASKRIEDGTERRELHSIFVHNDERGQGVGQSLMDDMHEWLGGSNILDVAECNGDAQRLYIRNGYRAVSTYVYDNQLPMVRMERQVQEDPLST